MKRGQVLAWRIWVAVDDFLARAANWLYRISLDEEARK